MATDFKVIKVSETDKKFFKTFREIKNIDIIELAEPYNKLNLPPAGAVKEALPILEDVVLKFENLGQVTYAEVDSRTSIITVYTYFRELYHFEPVAAYHILGSSLTAYCPPGIYKVAEERKMNVVDTAPLMLKPVLDVMAYIQYQLINQDTIIKTDRKKRVPAAGSNRKTPVAPSPAKRRVEVLNKGRVVYTVKGTDAAVDTVKRVYKKRAESWGVVGHMRRLKNGKTTWVKPYVKGTGPKAAKTYIVK